MTWLYSRWASISTWLPPQQWRATTTTTMDIALARRSMLYRTCPLATGMQILASGEHVLFLHYWPGLEHKQIHLAQIAKWLMKLQLYGRVYTRQSFLMTRGHLLFWVWYVCFLSPVGMNSFWYTYISSAKIHSITGAVISGRLATVLFSNYAMPMIWGSTLRWDVLNMLLCNWMVYAMYTSTLTPQ
jgi:hypothetical protein